ncbi:MAG: hypothetical protein WCI29_04700 [Actinomycetes bacterium]|jgi:hypothetical protein
MTTGTAVRVGRGRNISAWVIFVIAALLLPLAITAFWAQRTLTDTDRYVATVAPLSQDPTVQLAVSGVVSNAIINHLDVQPKIEALLPDKAKPLAPLIAGGVSSFITTEVSRLLASDRFDKIWADINKVMQKALIAALSGNPDGAVTISGDNVVLDTGNLIDIVKQRLVDKGLTFAADLPTPAKADREIVLLNAPQLNTARTAYAIAQPIMQWLIFLVLLALIGAVLLARNRPRMTMAVGIAFLISAVLVKLGLGVGQNELTLTLQGTPFAVAQQAFYSILTTFLEEGSIVLAVVGVVILAGGWYWSRTVRKAKLASSSTSTGLQDDTVSSPA